MANPAEGELAATPMYRASRTIVIVDMVESVRLMQCFELDVITRWRAFVAHVRSVVLPRHAGRMVKSLGDGLLLEFRSVHMAVRGATELLSSLERFNVNAVPEAAMHLRIGMHAADVVADEFDIYGAGVNVAQRLSTLAQPGDIVMSPQVREQVIPTFDGTLTDLGDCYLKHIDEPLRAFRLRRGSAAPQAPTALVDLRPGLAVLTFDAASDPSRDRVVAEVLCDGLIAALSRGSRLRLTSRLSTSQLQGRNVSLRQTAAALRVTYLLSGRILVDGDRLSVNAELANAESEEVLWTRTFVGSVSELLVRDAALVLDIAGNACQSILRHAIHRARHLPLPTLQAHALLLAGVALMHRFSIEDFKTAYHCLESLAERVPRHAEPFAWLARWHVFRAVQGWSDDPQADRGRALELSRRALNIDDESPLALTIAGSVQAGLAQDLQRADELYARALLIDPSEPLAWLLSGTAHAFKGEGPEAVRRTGIALDLSPLDPMRFFFDSHAASAALTAGQLDRAIELARLSWASNRMHLSTLRVLAIAQSLSGRLDEARATVTELLAVEPSFTVQSFLASRGSFGQAHAFAEALRAAGLPERLTA